MFSHKSLPWLLEEDGSGISYPVLKNLVAKNDSDPKVVKAREVACTTGHIAKILNHMEPEGYWVKPGGGYSPKYRSTVWSLIMLSQLGASVNDDPKIAKACRYYLDHALSKDGSISYNGTPSGTIDCLQGNMCAALTDLGYKDPRLDATYEWMAKSVVGSIDRYYAYKSGPDFACGANGKKPCAWGAVKVMLAFSKVPQIRLTPNMKAAIQKGVDLLLGVDPMTAAYPTVNDAKPNNTWWKFGFPVFYNTDLLQLAESLISLGYSHHSKLKSTLDFIVSKQDKEGRWTLEHDYPQKTWVNWGTKRKPNKWVTYRVLKVIKSLTDR